MWPLGVSDYVLAAGSTLPGVSDYVLAAGSTLPNLDGGSSNMVCRIKFHIFYAHISMILFHNNNLYVVFVVQD